VIINRDAALFEGCIDSPSGAIFQYQIDYLDALGGRAISVGNTRLGSPPWDTDRKLPCENVLPEEGVDIGHSIHAK
jgi:hypothetical protein